MGLHPALKKNRRETGLSTGSWPTPDGLEGEAAGMESSDGLFVRAVEEEDGDQEPGWVTPMSENTIAGLLVAAVGPRAWVTTMGSKAGHGTD